MAAQASCAACIGSLADVEFRLLPELDAAVVREHLSSCPDCRLFSQQLDTTRELVGGAPAPDLTVELGQVLERARSDLAHGGVEHALTALYRVASVLDVDNADELVQDTLTDAVSKGSSLSSVDLIDDLIRTWNGARSAPTEGLDGGPDPDVQAHDPDSETAELYYPDFYEEGPDAGRFIDSPNVWGHASRLAPEDELGTIELFEVVDAAINALPDIERRLISLVDIESVGFEEAARALRVPPRRAARALNRARIHVRGAIDNYMIVHEGAQ